MACGRQWPQWPRIARAAVASAGADGDVAPGSSSAGEMPSDIGCFPYAGLILSNNWQLIGFANLELALEWTNYLGNMDVFPGQNVDIT